MAAVQILSVSKGHARARLRDKEYRSSFRLFDAAAAVAALVAQVAAQGLALGNQIAALGNQIAALGVSISKSANSSATIGVDALQEVAGPANNLPSAAGVWFPATVFDLQGMSGVHGELSFMGTPIVTLRITVISNLERVSPPTPPFLHSLVPD